MLSSLPLDEPSQSNQEVVQLPTPPTLEEPPLVLSEPLDVPNRHEDTRDNIVQYFQTLYDTSVTTGKEALRIGPLLNDSNTLQTNQTGEDLFIRSIYNTFYQEVVETTKLTSHSNPCLNVMNFIFTGTPGIGLSCFRTYMIWRQIQTLKQCKGSGMIIACSDDNTNTLPVIGCLIRQGKFTDGMTTITDLHSILRAMKAEKIPVYAHIEVLSHPFQSSVPISFANYNFFYTSPDKAIYLRDLKLKYDGLCLMLPMWSIEELVEYYIAMGCSGVLLNALKVAGLANVPEEMRFRMHRIEVGKLTSVIMIDTGGEDEPHIATVCYEHLYKIVSEEAKRYGHLPRALFVSTRRKAIRQWNIEQAIARLPSKLGSNVSGICEYYHIPFVCSELISFIPDIKSNYLKYSVKWRGNNVEQEFIDCSWKLIADDV